MMTYVYISLGGSLGAVARYVFGGWVQRFLGFEFPFGTFLVNLTGCFVIGFAATLAGERLHTWNSLRSFFFVGFLGAYTTFSTYMFESVKLLQEGKAGLGLANLVGSVVLGFLALWLGIVLARWI